MPESMGKSRTTMPVYRSDYILVDERRSDKEPGNMVGMEQTYKRFKLQPLGKQSTEEDETLASEWLEEKTNGLKELGDVAAETCQRRRFPAPVAEAPESGAPSYVPDEAGQAAPSGIAVDVALSAGDILQRLADPNTSRDARIQFVCEAELIRFLPTEREALLGLLWQYILDNRDTDDPGALVAVGSAIRKFAAMMPMERMEDLAELIEPGHNAAPVIDVELEVAKMAYRNHEVYPPVEPNQRSRLAGELWRLAQDYLNPRFLPREKHSAVASLAIEALVAMRAAVAEQAWRAALECPYQWFGEMVSDHLATLRRFWLARSDSAVAWLDTLRDRVMKAAGK
jgi:hypothetical protein